MGISNLLKFIKPFIEPVHIKKYAGKRVGIDAYSWLYKGAYSCSMELCLDSEGNAKSRYLQYFMHRINLLRHYKITPIVVFDGGNIPCKSATENERQRRKEANLALAKEKLHQGEVNAAIELFQRAVSITPCMAHRLIQILRSEGIEFVVAPCEADAQLAYLSSLEPEQGGIVAVITEDSDLLAYGCPAIIFKMDRYGNGEEIVLEKVFNSGTGLSPSFRNFNKELFTGICVLAGCDFLPSVPGIGIKRAYSLVSKYRNLDSVLSVMKFNKHNQMPEDYAKSFREAVAVFQHARIFDAGTKTIKHLKPLPEKLLQSLDGNLDFLGPDIPSSVATAIAEGHLDPITMEAFDNLQNAESFLDPIATQASDQVLRAEIQVVVSTQESCFSLFSSCETTGKRNTDTEQKVTLDKRNYLREAVILEKLITPLEFHQKVDDIVEKREFPDNNPFKKRKVADFQLEQMQTTTDQASKVIDAEESDKVRERREFLKNPFKKIKLDLQLEQRPTATEQVSEVIDVDELDEISGTPESQKSVKSKPMTLVIPNKRKEGNKKRLNSKISCKSSEHRSYSILNFFTRL
ncbi:exonuclease 1 [Telopea speciosissima]|uniref:exonuclease 1 n=1 Tax=Telopea speciosissima TaxID=54955 RepID=UPI001CC7C04C|nr:exonuclease 1 [Telopea speciosissima]